MFKELHPNNCSDAKCAADENRSLDIRSIVKESIDLPAEILRADFSHIHDRILDQKTISDLINPPATDTTTVESEKRYLRRKEALVPYLDKRLVCVCFRLPGIMYTIEVDPEAEEVVHWEWQSA